MTERADVVIVGGGHNGLAAAAYLALAGRSVVVLERLEHVGGAAVSAEVFPGIDARLSRYSYLVSPAAEADHRRPRPRHHPARRRYSSYTPVPGTDRGLLIDRRMPQPPTSRARRRTPAAWTSFYDGTERMAKALFPTVTEPLLTRSEARAALGDDAVWRDLVDEPIGDAIAREFADDLVRGVVLTDALIGTFAPNVDPELHGNRCFLYHVIGGGTGDWDVPVGGMGAVSGELARAAQLAGARILTDAEVTAINPDGVVSSSRGRLRRRRGARQRGARTSSPACSATSRRRKPEGAQVKANLLVSRLPRLRDDVDPEAAFGGTFHINETWTQLDAAYDAAASGQVPDPLPCEIYCHSLTDPSILSPELRESGAQTLTVFGLHVPDRLHPDRDDLQATGAREPELGARRADRAAAA